MKLQSKRPPPERDRGVVTLGCYLDADVEERLHVTVASARGIEAASVRQKTPSRATKKDFPRDASLFARRASLLDAFLLNVLLFTPCSVSASTLDRRDAFRLTEPDRVETASQDPYVKVTLLRVGENERPKDDDARKTRVIMPKPRNEPTWNETFVYDHVSRFSDSVVMLELYDKNGFGADEAMAQVVLPVKSLPQVREVLKERRSPRERGRMGTSV